MRWIDSGAQSVLVCQQCLSATLFPEMESGKSGCSVDGQQDDGEGCMLRQAYMAAGAVLGLSWGCGCIIKDCYTSVVAENVLGVLPPSQPSPALQRNFPFLLVHFICRTAASGRAAVAVRSEEGA